MKMALNNIDVMNEEFNNFLHKVNQVNNIIGKLASPDNKLQEIGDLEAKQYLGDGDQGKYETIVEDNIKIKCNRTVINRKALLREDNPSKQSQEAFMEEVSKDADRRYKDRLRRKERMETLKKQATLAFRRGEFEKALSLYTKAIEHIKDCCLLYTNRALTYIKLKFYDKAVDDCVTALKLNEESLKARLLLAKAHYLNQNRDAFLKAVEEAKDINSEKSHFIEDFVKKLSAMD